MSGTSGADDLFGRGWGGTAPSASGAGADPGSPATLGPVRFGSDDGPASTFVVVKPPLVWIYLAVGTGILALALAIALWGSIPAAITGWVLGGPITIALTSIYRFVDTARRTQIGYSSGSRVLTTTLHIAALALGLSAVVIAGLDIALWAGRGF